MKPANPNELSVFQQIVEGLDESIAFSRGQLTLHTTRLPQSPPVPSPGHVASIRKKHKMSQSVFAATLNVSPKTVQAWEQGTRVPQGGALRLLELIDKDPSILGKVFSNSSPQTRAGMRNSDRP